MEKTRASSEYAAQLLGLPPNTIADILLGTLDSTVTECIEVLEQSMLSSSLSSDIPKEELIKGIAQLKARFVRKMEPISSKLERYLIETVFRVPDHVLLPEDAAQRTKHTVKGHQKLRREIESIKKEIEAEKYTKAILKGKLKEAEMTYENMKAMAVKIETTTAQVFQEKNLTNIEENSVFIRTKIETCKKQINELQEIIPLPDENSNVNKGFRLNENQLPLSIRLHRS